MHPVPTVPEPITSPGRSLVERDAWAMSSPRSQRRDEGVGDEAREDHAVGRAVAGQLHASGAQDMA